MARGPSATAAVLDAGEAGLFGGRIADIVAAGRQHLTSPGAVAELTGRAAVAAGPAAAVGAARLPIAARRATRPLVAGVAIGAAAVLGASDAVLVENCRADAVATCCQQLADARARADLAVDATGTTLTAAAVAPAVLAVARWRAARAVVADRLVRAGAVDQAREAVLAEVRVAEPVAAARERHTLRAARARFASATPGRTLTPTAVGPARLAVARRHAASAVVADSVVVASAVLGAREAALVCNGLAGPVAAVDELDARRARAAYEGAGARGVVFARLTVR